MKKFILPATLLFFMFSCTSKEKGNEENDSTKQVQTTKTNMNSFDLSKINFTENLTALLNKEGLKLADGKSSEQTLMGYATYTATESPLLTFGGKALAGTSATGKNQVVIHYSEQNGIVGLYELKIYTAQQANELIAALNTAFGKPAFEKNDQQSGSIELDENGDEVKASEASKKVYRVWETASGISYFLIQTGVGNDLYLELTALNQKEKTAKDWIAFRAFNWYKK